MVIFLPIYLPFLLICTIIYLSMYMFTYYIYTYKLYVYQSIYLSRQCEVILETILRDRSLSEPFKIIAKPNDRISGPMDLDTVERNLNSGQYPNADIFAADFRWWFHLCITFKKKLCVIKTFFPIAKRKLSQHIITFLKKLSNFQLFFL